MLFVYPLGIPALYWTLLRLNLNAIRPNNNGRLLVVNVVRKANQGLGTCMRWLGDWCRSIAGSFGMDLWARNAPTISVTLGVYEGALSAMDESELAVRRSPAAFVRCDIVFTLGYDCDVWSLQVMVALCEKEMLHRRGGPSRWTASIVTKADGSSKLSHSPAMPPSAGPHTVDVKNRDRRCAVSYTFDARSEADVELVRRVVRIRYLNDVPCGRIPAPA